MGSLHTFVDLPPFYKASLVTEVGEGTSGGSCAGSSEPHPGSDVSLPPSPVVTWICLNIRGLGNEGANRTLSGHPCLSNLSVRDFLNPQVTAKIHLPAEDKMTFNGEPQR